MCHEADFIKIPNQYVKSSLWWEATTLWSGRNRPGKYIPGVGDPPDLRILRSVYVQAVLREFPLVLRQGGWKAEKQKKPYICPDQRKPWQRR